MYKIFTGNFLPFKNLIVKFKPGIIYLAGPNGSGKSRLISSLLEKKAIIQNEQNQHIDYRVGEWPSKTYDHIAEVTSDLANVKQVLTDTGQTNIENAETTITENTRNPETGRVITQTSVEYIPSLHKAEFSGLEMLFTGTKHLYQKFNIDQNELMSCLPDWEPKKNSTSSKLPNIGKKLSFVFWEEPETALNPRVQKDIPLKIVEWYQKFRQQQHGQLALIVTTHSPFILANVGKTNGVREQIISLNPNVVFEDRHELTPMNIAEGQTLALQILGGNIGDLMPRPVVIAEQSILDLLENVVRNLDYELPATLVSSGGDGEIDLRLSDAKKIQKVLSRVSNRWPERQLLDLQFWVIVDDQQAAENVGFETDEEEGISVKTWNLGTTDLEASYPTAWVDNFLQSRGIQGDYDKGTKMGDFLRAVLEEERYAEIGKLKCELAAYVGSQISNMQHLNETLPKVHTMLTEWGKAV